MADIPDAEDGLRGDEYIAEDDDEYWPDDEDCAEPTDTDNEGTPDFSRQPFVIPVISSFSWKHYIPELALWLLVSLLWTA